MNKEDFKILMEEQGIDEQRINEFLETLPVDTPQKILPGVDENEELKRAIAQTDDWREKARMAAKIISNNLE